MLRIRLFKAGRKKQPFYKLVVTDKENPPSGGRFVDELGFYDPHKKECNVDGERAQEWIQKGARLSSTAKNLLIKQGIIKGKKENVFRLSKRKKEELAKKEEEKVKDAEKEEQKEEEQVNSQEGAGQEAPKEENESSA